MTGCVLLSVLPKTEQNNSPRKKGISKVFGLLFESAELTTMNTTDPLNIVTSLVCELEGFLLAKDSIFCLLFVFN